MTFSPGVFVRPRFDLLETWLVAETARALAEGAGQDPGGAAIGGCFPACWCSFQAPHPIETNGRRHEAVKRVLYVPCCQHHDREDDQDGGADADEVAHGSVIPGSGVRESRANARATGPARSVTSAPDFVVRWRRWRWLRRGLWIFFGTHASHRTPMLTVHRAMSAISVTQAKRNQTYRHFSFRMFASRFSA